MHALVRPLLLAAVLVTGCSLSVEDGTSSSELDVRESVRDLASTECSITATTAEQLLATAGSDGEAILTVEAQALSPTSWAEKGNEAVVLEVLREGARLGHLILHQGADRFSYAMHTGALRAGDALTVRVSSLTAARATKGACIVKATLAAPSLEMVEGVAHAPIMKWPTQKSFDDVPMLLGWSRSAKSYQLAYTHENGGTVELCGGGARGMRSEIARWGRGLDLEGVWYYGDGGRYPRCTGPVSPAPNAPRMADAHPILYYGNGHNGLHESRAGYKRDCGASRDNAPDGDLDGWNENSPGGEPEKDDPFTIVLRPVPVDMDALGVAKYAGRREGIVDTYAPWLYRIVDSELARENRIDDSQTFRMDRYLFIDVYAMDVGGSGDETCGPGVGGGFRLRVRSKDGTVSNGPQMTADYFGGNGSGVKRLAVPLKPGVKAQDITHVTFDAYDDDGIYFMGIGDAFVPRASGSNGAVLDYVHRGLLHVGVYVDDDASSCVAGKNTKDGVAYPCTGSAFTLTL